MSDDEFPSELLTIAREATLVFVEDHEPGYGAIDSFLWGNGARSYTVELGANDTRAEQVQAFLHELFHFDKKFIGYSLRPRRPVQGAEPIVSSCGFRIIEYEDNRDDGIEAAIEACGQAVYRTKPDIVAELTMLIETYQQREEARHADLPF